MKIYAIKVFLYRMINRVKNQLIAHRFSHLDPSCRISKDVNFFGSKNISIGAHTIIHTHAVIQASLFEDLNHPYGTINIGAHCMIHPYAYINACGGDVKIGEHCSIHPYVMLYGQGGLSIGNNVRIGVHSTLIPANHVFDSLDVPIYKQGMVKLGITVEDDVWIGANVVILDGVCVAKGCIIGSGSVVTKTTAPDGIYVGNPAHRIKDR